MRHAFDKFEVPYDLIYKERVKKGDLKGAYDVIVVPNQGGSGKRLVFDIETAASRSHTRRATSSRTSGMYGESDDITGGMGLEGVAEFEKFVKAGGLLVTLGQASFFPAEFGLAPNVDAARTSAAVLRARPDRRGGDPAAGAPDLLRLRQEDDPGPLRERSAAHRQTGANPFERAAARPAADAAGRADAVSRRRRPRAERA